MLYTSTKMTTQQIKNKIAELEQWLQDNPNHTNRTLIETDLRNLRSKQIEKNKSKTYKYER